MPPRKKSAGPAKVVTDPAQLPLGFDGWRHFTPDQLRKQITDKEGEAARAQAAVAELKMFLRNQANGAASKDKPRRRRFPLIEIWSTYDEERVVGNSGAVERTAKRLGCATKTVVRALNRQEMERPELVGRRFRSTRRKIASAG